MPDMWMDVDVALSEVPINILALTDDTDFKSKEEGVVYNQAGLDLVWNFVTTAGAFTQTEVTPTTGGDYDLAHQGNAMYTIEIPDAGGASINNDTEGFGWFTGIATGILHWRGPTIGFRAAGLNNLLIDSAYSAARGLGGTALPDAVADAAGGLPISDAGGLDLDAIKAKTDNQPAGIKKNVALSNFMFLMIDSTDHISPKTGLTVSGTISGDGGAFGALTNAISEVSSGWYKVNITQAEMNKDIVSLRFTAAGADTRNITIKTSA